MRNNPPPFPGGLAQNTGITVAFSQSASASMTFNVTNLFGRSAFVYFNIHSLPGSASTTLALKVRAVDPATGGFVAIGALNARSATGMTALALSPYQAALSAGGQQNVNNTIVARDLSILVSQSSGATSKDVVFSIGMHFNV